jgi:[acyl-carrier-protein] S-malonyltransferase
MADAAREIERIVDEVEFADPRVPLLSNAEAAPITTGEAARHELVHHLTHGVAWTRTVRTMADAGVDTFIEVGPGRVLTGLIKRIAPEATAHALDDAAAPGRLSLPAEPIAAAAASAG